MRVVDVCVASACTTCPMTERWDTQTAFFLFLSAAIPCACVRARSLRKRWKTVSFSAHAQDSLLHPLCFLMPRCGPVGAQHYLCTMRRAEKQQSLHFPSRSSVPVRERQTGRINTYIGICVCVRVVRFVRGSIVCLGARGGCT